MILYSNFGGVLKRGEKRKGDVVRALLGGDGIELNIIMQCDMDLFFFSISDPNKVLVCTQGKTYVPHPKGNQMSWHAQLSCAVQIHV